MRKHGIFTEILKKYLLQFTQPPRGLCECPPAGLALVTLDNFTGLTVFLCSVAAICLTTFKSETT